MSAQAPVDPAALRQAPGEKKARLFEVYGYPLLARKPK